VTCTTLVKHEGFDRGGDRLFKGRKKKRKVTPEKWKITVTSQNHSDNSVWRGGANSSMLQGNEKSVETSLFWNCLLVRGEGGVLKQSRGW